MVHEYLEVWQGSQNLCATKKESHTQTKQMTAIGCISDTEEIVKASWSNIQHDGAAAFKLPDRLPLPPALSAKDLPGGQTQVLNVCRIRTIDHHATESDEDSATESISDTENWVNWNGDSENPNDSEDDWEADNESDIAPGNGIEDLASEWWRNVTYALNVLWSIHLTWRSTKPAETVSMMVNAMDTRRNIGTKKMKNRMHQYFFTRFSM